MPPGSLVARGATLQLIVDLLGFLQVLLDRLVGLLDDLLELAGGLGLEHL